MPTPEEDLHRIDIQGEETLWRLLRGKGFVLPHDERSGLVVLLRGKAGTGKSTFALQLLDRMHESGCRRVYCTLEQSQRDLEAKRARMWATRAVDDAWVARYSKERLVVERKSLAKTLGRRLGRKLADAVIKDALRSAKARGLPVTPLFDEPEDQGRASFNRFLDALTDSIQMQRPRPGKASRQMEIWDDDPNRSESPEQPFSGLHLRCVAAERMVNSLCAPCDCQERAPRRHDRPIVVLDGLSLLSQIDREAVALQGIVEKLRRNAQLAILVYEPNVEEAPYLDHHADMVIELTEERIGQPNRYLIHELCIRKARYQEAALGRHQFKIRGSGIVILPSLHFQVHHHHYMDMELERSSGEHPEETRPAKTPDDGAGGIGSLIDMICRPNPGEAAVLLGPRNAFKTELCLDYLSCGTWGCPVKAKEKGKGLLVSLIDNAPDIQRGLKCPWAERSLKCPWKTDRCGKKAAHIWHARPYCQRPGYITPAEFFHFLKRRMAKDPMKEGDRVVFWDLTQIDYRFPLFRDDRMLLPALMDTFRTQKMRSLFMGAGNASNSRAASAMADHVIFCWRSAGRPEEAKKGGGKTPRPSLMLYVDRASAASNRRRQALYRIPIGRGDKLDLGSLGNLDEDVGKGGLREDLLRLLHNEDHPDARAIRRITSMQDVPGEMSAGW